MISLNKAIFFDRDGVINDNSRYYTYKTEDVVFNDGIFEALKLFQDNDYLIFIVTNQSGIAKCVYTHNDVLEVHRFMSAEFKKRNITITNFYYCPHYPEQSKCICRKPDSLLLEKAIARYKIDKNCAHFIGDMETDMLAAKKAGVKGHLIESNSNIIELARKICQYEVGIL